MEMEERIKSLEKQVARLQRKQPKKIMAALTPYPISNCVTGENVEGPILRYMFSATGRITKGLVRITNSMKSGAEVEVCISSDIGREHRVYNMSRQSILIEPDFEVYSGDRMTIFITPAEPEEKITEVWTSFLWIPNIKEVEVKKFLISELKDA